MDLSGGAHNAVDKTMTHMKIRRFIPNLIEIGTLPIIVFSTLRSGRKLPRESVEMIPGHRRRRRGNPHLSMYERWGGLGNLREMFAKAVFPGPYHRFVPSWKHDMIPRLYVHMSQSWVIRSVSEIISANSATWNSLLSMTFDANSGHYVQYLPEKGGVESDIDRV